jgi:beta-lactamase class A
VSYYRLDGVSGVFAPRDAHVQEQNKTWRLNLASFLVLFMLGLSGTAISVFSSVEQVAIELPKASALSPSPAPLPKAAAPAVLAQSQDSAPLQQELEAFTAGKPSEWAFYVQSLDSGETMAEVNQTKQFQMASIYKLFLIKPLANKLPAEAWANNSIAGRTYLDCVQAMLAVSDNPCAEAIAGSVGWNNLHKHAQSTGYKSTVLNSTENFVSTASDTGLLLERLYHGDGYDTKTKGIALEALGRKKSVEAVRKACAGCIVYNKTGDLNGYKHDAAIVEKNGKAYVVVIFSSGASWHQLTEAAGIIAKQL